MALLVRAPSAAVSHLRGSTAYVGRDFVFPLEPPLAGRPSIAASSSRAWPTLPHACTLSCPLPPPGSLSPSFQLAFLAASARFATPSLYCQPAVGWQGKASWGAPGAAHDK